jgi:hypothetical protein
MSLGRGRGYAQIPCRPAYSPLLSQIKVFSAHFIEMTG